MRLPNRPTSIAELKERIDSGELRESRVLEFKRQFPKNEDTARGIAGLAAEGGVLVIGVAEEQDGLRVAPIDCNGVRERAENIARDIPKPPVQVESHILDDDAPGRGVLWIEIPASPAMLHQVNSTYYWRDDTQTRPMSDPEVADRMALRTDRRGPIEQALADALARDEPAAPSRHGRTCIVARPIGADPEEFYASTREPADWKSFASEFRPSWRFTTPVPDQYWGHISHRRQTPTELPNYCDIDLQEDGAFCYLSYSQDWLRENEGGIAPFLTLLACRDAIALVVAIQERTGQRRMWDLAFSISDVEGRTSRPQEAWRSFYSLRTAIPQDAYRRIVLGISTSSLEGDARSVGRELAGRFIAECGLGFDAEWPAAAP